MNEYLGIYDEEWIELHTVKIKANTKEEAVEKFKEYLTKRTSSYFCESKLYVIPLFAIETI